MLLRPFARACVVALALFAGQASGGDFPDDLSFPEFDPFKGFPELAG